MSIAGRDYAVLFQELAAIPAKALGEPIGNLRSCRAELIAALDVLLTGI